MMSPKFSPEPNIVKRYKGFRKYKVSKKKKSFHITVDADGNVFHAVKSFSKYLNKSFSELEKVLIKNNVQIELIGDVDNEMWCM